MRFSESFLTMVSSYLQFYGWIRKETLCDRSSVTFDLRQCEIGTEQYARQSTPMAHSAGLAHADRASRGTTSQTARPVSATGNSSSASSNPK